MTSANAVQSRQSIRFRGRSFVAFVLAPSAARRLAARARPLEPDLAEFLRQPADHPGCHVAAAHEAAIAGSDRHLGRARHPHPWPGGGGGRPTRPAAAAAHQGRPSGGGGTGESASAPRPRTLRPAGRRNEPNSLLLESPIRSGQSVVFPYGDVTVLGSVSSGAEVVAGGSIHVYGALRGRAMAGAMGNARARIFCSRNEAELIAIDGYYHTAEDMEAALRGRPVQCWLDDRSSVRLAALD